MGDEVNIPFSLRLEPGQSSFVVKVGNKFVNETNRKFSITSCMLMPEYRNIQAFVYGLDSKRELETIERHQIQFEVSYGAKYFSNAWINLSSTSDLSTILKSVNQHFDETKPTGTYLPPVFFDWIHLQALDENETAQSFSEKMAQEAYGEAFSSTKHATWLPQSLAEMTEMNNCIFPTTKKTDFLEEVRLRMWIGPNTTVAFPNDQLPLALGFQAEQIPSKSVKNQVRFVNEDHQKYQCLMAWSAPTVNIPVKVVRDTKIHCYLTKDSIRSPFAILETRKKREYYPALLAEDYGPTIRELGKSINCFVGLEYDPTSSKFKITFPENPDIYLRIYLPMKVLIQLGFQNDYIDKNSDPSVVKENLDTKNFVEKGQALVQSTGMVIVALEEYRYESSNSEWNEMIMVALSPKMGGSLCDRKYTACRQEVCLSRFDPDMHFVLYRLNDRGQKRKLNWPVGSYIHGILTGKV